MLLGRAAASKHSGALAIAVLKHPLSADPGPRRLSLCRSVADAVASVASMDPSAELRQACETLRHALGVE